jgi:hypothetical protein
MASLIGAVALALIASTSVMNTGAMARPCDDDSIDTVSDDGAIVTRVIVSGCNFEASAQTKDERLLGQYGTSTETLCCPLPVGEVVRRRYP